MNINLLYLGGLGAFLAQNHIVVLSDMGYNVTVVNTSHDIFRTRIKECPEVSVTNLYETKEIVRRHLIRNRIRDALLKNKAISRLVFSMAAKAGTTQAVPKIGNEAKEKLLKIISENQIDVIYSFWGINVFPEIKAIKEENLSIPVINNIQSYPYNYSVVGNGSQENPSYGEMFQKIEGRIHCSQNMYDYLNTHFNLRDYGKDIVLMEYFSERYFYKKRLKKLSDDDGEPHIVSIGRTDFSRRPLDDIRKQIYEIADERVHFHLKEPDVPMKKHKYIHTFPGIPSWKTIDGSLANFLTQFDACIILFNIRKKYNRFYNSLPARFLFAFTAGIPIVMPEGYFASCEEIVNKYEIGFSYGDVRDLKAKLCNEELMEKCKRNAVKKTKNFTFEKNFHKVDSFIKDIVNTY